MRLVLFACLFCSPFWLSAQQTISGYVTDSETGEYLIGANVYLEDFSSGTSTNIYGFYSLTTSSTTIKVTYSYVGYEPQRKEIELSEDMKLDVALSMINELGVAEVTSDASEQIQQRTQMSSVEIPMIKVKSLPVFMGEKDILKTVQLLPGVQSGTEGSSGFYVRGGGPDQNLILLDGVPVYNASHLFGFFSVFNPDAIRNVQLIKGGFPARYGGRLSSVLDIRMKEGNTKKFSGEGSIGLISSKLTFEGPLKLDKGSFLISGRRTYIDALTRPIARIESDGDATGGYFFHDYNGKLNYSFNPRNRLFLSGYFGKDNAFARFDEGILINPDEKETASLEWGNIIGAARWNHEIGNQLFLNTTLTFSRYEFVTGFEVDAPDERFLYEYNSGIQDFGLKADLDYIPNPDHYVKFGAGSVYHTFTPGVNKFELSTAGETAIDTTFGSTIINSGEFYAYIEDDWKINDLLKVNVGVHSSSFLVNNESYFSVQPRIAGRYLINEKVSVKAAYSSMAQYLHLLTNAGIGLPTDLWLPVTDTIPPQLSHQIAIGIATTLKHDLELSVEGYYKTMENLIEYKDGASFFANADDWQSKVELGRGWSYGAEVLLEKKRGKFTGWIGYTLSWSERQFDNLNFGNKFPYRYDRRHDLGIALTYLINDNVDMGLVYVYGTGNAVTLPTGTYLAAGTEGAELDNPFANWTPRVDHISERNGYRTPSYHRLDFGVNIHKQKKHYERTWSFGVYNLYNRQNPFFLYFDQVDDENAGLFQISLFPIIPSFSWAFKF